MFFVSFMIISQYLLINFLTLILFKNFEDYYRNPNNPITIFQNNLYHFRLVWSQYCDEKLLKKLNVNKVIDFFKILGSPLGFFLN